jgi:hypothetical protein
VVSPNFSKPTDDPTLLRERADALRDQADKLGKEQVALAARIQSARDQGQLEEQLRQLNGDEALFDESDQRIRLSRTDPASTSAKTPAIGQAGTSGGTGTGGGGARSSAVSETYGSQSATDVNQPGSTLNSASDPALPQPSVAPSATAVPNSPSVQTGQMVLPGQLGRAGAEALDDADASLPELLRAQKMLEQERAKLQAQAQALDAQAAGK